MKIKVDQNFLEVGMGENGCGQSGHGNLKLTVSEEWTDSC